MVTSDSKPARDVLHDIQTSGQDNASRSRRRDLLALITLTVAYWFFASNGLQWANVVGAGSPIWPAAGVALAGLALGGIRLWPAIFLGRVIAAITIGSSNPPWVVIGISAGNALAYVIPVWLLRTARVDLRLTTIADVLWIIGASALSAIIEASLGVAALALGHALPPAGMLSTWIDWVYGNFAGAIVVAPLLLAWTCNSLRAFDWRTFVHLALSLAFVAVLGWLVFFSDERTGLWRTWHIFPALVWAALAFQVRGATAALLVASVIAVLGISQGTGPFMPLAQGTGQSAELLIQQFVGLTGSTILLLAAAADERRGKEALRNIAIELQRQTSELETLYREAPVGMMLIGRDRRFLRINEAMAEINGVAIEATLERTVREVLPALADSLEPLYARIVATGEPIIGTEVSGITPKAPDRIQYWIVSGYPIMDDGVVQAVSCVVQEITARKEAENRERLLAREVDHRAKNLLAVVQGLVQLTRANDIASFITAVVGRIQALGRAHSLLSASRWEGVHLRQLITEELAPFLIGNGFRIDIDGPALQLRPAAAQSLALVLHELATNANKYGALSSKEGKLDIDWEVKEHNLRLRWQEHGGPPVTPPTHRGFGSSLIRSSIERQLKGAVSFDWRPEGLACDLVIPAEQLVSMRANHPSPAKSLDGPAEGQMIRSAEEGRVLVLEDEALVAMQIEEALMAAGCTIVGPAARVTEALDLLRRDTIDVALLDINVAGDRSFPVADLLTAMKVPFAFCTGYETALILPTRFQGAMVLPKPFSAAELVNAIRRLLRSAPGRASNVAALS